MGKTGKTQKKPTTKQEKAKSSQGDKKIDSYFKTKKPAEQKVLKTETLKTEKFMCNECKKIFTYKRNAKLHQQIHQVVNIYKTMTKGQSKPVFTAEFREELENVVAAINLLHNPEDVNKVDNVRELRSRSK